MSNVIIGNISINMEDFFWTIGVIWNPVRHSEYLEKNHTNPIHHYYYYYYYNINTYFRFGFIPTQGAL